MCFNFVSKLWYIVNKKKIHKTQRNFFSPKFRDEQSLNLHLINLLKFLNVKKKLIFDGFMYDLNNAL